MLPVFTSPSIATSIRKGSRLRSRRTLISVVKIVAGHDSLEAVVVCEQEGCSNLVLPVIVTLDIIGGCQDSSSSTMTSLVVVIVNKDNSMHTISHSPVLVVDASKTIPISAIDTLGKFYSVPELRHLSNSKVLLDTDRFTAHVNNLVEEKRTTSLRKIFGLSLYSLQISRPHVLAGINTESFNSDVDHIVEIRRDLLPHVLLAAVQVVEADQVAVTDLLRVAVVLNLAVGLVEVQAAEGDSVVILASSVEAGSSSALARASPTRHMIDNCVNDDPEQ